MFELKDPTFAESPHGRIPMARQRQFAAIVAALVLFSSECPSWAQTAPPKETAQIKRKLAELQQVVDGLKSKTKDMRLLADVDVYAKATEWILRHDEFYLPRKRKGKPQGPSRYLQYTLTALETGLARARELSGGKSPWVLQTGSTIRGYYSRVDGSVQPYALSLPEGINPKSGKRWPLYVKLHGRGGTRNEPRFINEHDNKPLPKEQTWIQLDVFGRTDNAYRWSGETDVFEAIKDVKRRYRIDDKRITLWGFSMGGAGAWHLGLHHPSMWSSVGPGAGFVDFYKYQKQTKKRVSHEHAALHIYDAIDYALNAENVPICTYGGELDAQLAASTEMVDAANKLNVPIKLLVGPGMGHGFHPDSFKEFMAFHLAHSKKGRKRYPGRRNIRFISYTLKYNRCEWLQIEEMFEMYKPAVVEGGVDKTGVLKLKTQNVAALQIARDVAFEIEIDGIRMPLSSAADSLLPGVYYRRENDDSEWELLSYDSSRTFTNNPRLHKRHNLQGPIDDAFMEAFVCVRGTGNPWSAKQQAWANWTLDRFSREFDKWLRGKVPTVDDKGVTEEMILRKNLVLFGDPGSNSVLAKIVDKLPIDWTENGLVVNGEDYDPDTHGVSLIYPNPLNPNRYVVVNSGHTIHEKDFKASNSWLFPRLGDIAVQKFGTNSNGGFDEHVVWAALFDSRWNIPAGK